MVVLGGMGNVWGVMVGALILAWTNSTFLPHAQEFIAQPGKEGFVSVTMMVLGAGIFAAGIALIVLKRRPGMLLAYLGVPIFVIGLVLIVAEQNISFQFLIFGSVLIIMMLFRREGIIPEARTRLILREPGRTEAEAVGADMEDIAPELESLPDDAVHASGSVPAARTDRDGTQGGPA